MKERGVYVAHCPQSNTNLASGIAPVRRYLDEGLNQGLGSDVAGGSTLSIFRAMADAIQVSKLRWRLQDQSLAPLTAPEAFWLGTAGGGAFFGKVGSFDPATSWTPWCWTTAVPPPCCLSRWRTGWSGPSTCPRTGTWSRSLSGALPSGKTQKSPRTVSAGRFFVLLQSPSSPAHQDDSGGDQDHRQQQQENREVKDQVGQVGQRFGGMLVRAEHKD